MLQHSSTIESYARELLENEWCKFLQASPEQHRDVSIPDSCTIMWLTPVLVDMMAETHEQPADKLGPMIRRLLVEQHFCDDNGDNVVADAEEELLDNLVRLIVQVLERVRRSAIANGQWSNAPVTPLMCG